MLNIQNKGLFEVFKNDLAHIKFKKQAPEGDLECTFKYNISKFCKNWCQN